MYIVLMCLNRKMLICLWKSGKENVLVCELMYLLITTVYFTDLYYRN